MDVTMHGYAQSTHNLSKAWRSTMAPGVLVPAYVQLGLNKTSLHVSPAAVIKTLPTVGPLYGSFKFQLDFFTVPLRLYNRQLHNNKFGIGMSMDKVKFPTLKIGVPNISQQDPTTGVWDLAYINTQEDQISASSLLHYLGRSGYGWASVGMTPLKDKPAWYTVNDPMAQFALAYFDIGKNYYANKQEDTAYVIGATAELTPTEITLVVINGQESLYPGNDQWLQPQGGSDIELKGSGLALNNISINLGQGFGSLAGLRPSNGGVIVSATSQKIVLRVNETRPTSFRVIADSAIPTFTPEIVPFRLANLDDIREEILSAPNDVPYVFNNDNATAGMPMTQLNGPLYNANDAMYRNKSSAPMNGLMLKTYLSDRFNNWIKGSWISGDGSVSDLSKVVVNDGTGELGFTMDSLNLMQKIYNLLNRIVVNGNTYMDWQKSVYGFAERMSVETPIYQGGMSMEVTFDEVFSTAESGESPLGTLAGRGQSNHLGGKVKIFTPEPSIIMAIASLTPRIDYSQGNKWWTRLETMDDLHKPELDAIGFQDLLTDEMHAASTARLCSSTTAGEVADQTVYSSAGKQPAWIEYMTDQNECHGGFAVEASEMFMTLNRQYELNPNTTNISDLTTYIDPAKYNYAFARTDLAAQNFWVNIGYKVTARRVMSGKLIPYL